MTDPSDSAPQPKAPGCAPIRMRLEGTVRFALAGDKRRIASGAVRVGAIGLAALVATAGVLVGVRLLAGEVETPSGPPVGTLDGRSVNAVPGSARLVLLGPRVVLDSRGTGELGPGVDVRLPLPGLPAGSTAVLLEVSLLRAAGPGAVTIGSAAGERTVLQLPAATMTMAAGTRMMTATVVVPVLQDGQLRVRSEGGGHLVVNLVGAFEPADTASAGRIVRVPATQVARLAPSTDGKDATITLAGVPGLPTGAGSVSALLLRIAADVGPNGGFVAAGASVDALDQTVFWMPTAADDRTRGGFLVVPVTGESVHLHYEAGDLLTADIVGYVTAASAAETAAGLVVPVPPGPTHPVRLAAGETADVTVVPPGGDVPADRVAAALLGVTATGDALGGVAVHPPGAAADPTLTAARGVPRSALTLVPTAGGAVTVGSQAGATVTLSPQVLILTG